MSIGGETPKTPDATLHGVVKDTDCHPCTMSSGCSIAQNIFGGQPCCTVYIVGALHSKKDDFMPLGSENKAVDGMEIKTVSNGRGPWQPARAPQR